MPQPKTRSTRNKSTQSNQQTSKKIDETIEKTKEKGKQIVSDAKEETSKIAEQQLQTVAHQINNGQSA